MLTSKYGNKFLFASKVKQMLFSSLIINIVNTYMNLKK